MYQPVDEFHRPRHQINTQGKPSHTIGWSASGRCTGFCIQRRSAGELHRGVEYGVEEVQSLCQLFFIICIHGRNKPLHYFSDVQARVLLWGYVHTHRHGELTEVLCVREAMDQQWTNTPCMCQRSQFNVRKVRNILETKWVHDSALGHHRSEQGVL